MSRIRSVHPGLWSDERFVSVTPLARLLFLGIWNECDDQGSFEWSPLKLKMRLLPAETVDAAPLLAEPAETGCVMAYEMGGRRYGAVRNFCRWQRPKKPNSVYPQNDEVREWVDLAARHSRTGSEADADRFGTSGEPVRKSAARGRREEGDSPLPEGNLSYGGNAQASAKSAGVTR